MTRAEFAARFKAARIATGMTQQEAADRLGCVQPYIAKLETGVVVPRVDRLTEIMATLGLEAATIFPEFFQAGTKR
jgi:transcriptional regulator with XRE-family HTH domain